MFGENVNIDYLEDMIKRDSTSTQVMCSLFGIILILHLPYTMLLAKESLLVMYGEIANRSLSQHLLEMGLTEEPMTIREDCLDEDKSL